MKGILETSIAGISDLDIVFKYASQIVEQHIAFDPARFAKLPNHYKLLRAYFADALSSTDSTVIVLKNQKGIVGYALVVMETASLIDLAPERAWLHDIYIDESARGLGGGKMLLDESKKAAQKLGSNILMLHVSEKNKFAQRLFSSKGFETTIFEMMCTL